MDYWDPNRPNIVLLADDSDPLWMMKCNGVERLASELRKANYQVAIINHLHVFDYEELKYFLSHIINRNTLFIGISNFFFKNIAKETKGAQGEVYWPFNELGQMVPHGDHLNKDFREFLRLLNPRAPVVMGGPDTFDGPWSSMADYLVMGFADRSIVNLANHLTKGESLRFNAKSKFGPMVIRDYKADGLEFNEVKSIKRSYDCYLQGETLPIETARGCIFKCHFCSYPFIGKKKFDYIRLKDILLEEFIDNYERYGISNYVFSDDTFNDSVHKMEHFVDIQKQLPKPIQFWSYLRQDLLRLPGMMEGLYGAGHRAGQFGLETWTLETGKRIAKQAERGKTMHNLELYRDFPTTKGHGTDYFNSHSFFIVGLPGESIAQIRDGYEFMNRHNFPLDSAIYVPLKLENPAYNPFPSQMASNPESYGYTITKSHPRVRSWKNEHMNSTQAADLTRELNAGIRDQSWNTVDGRMAFYAAGLGIELDDVWGKRFENFPWHHVWNQKQKRAFEYKKLLALHFNIDFNKELDFKPAMEQKLKFDKESKLDLGVQIYSGKNKS